MGNGDYFSRNLRAFEFFLIIGEIVLNSKITKVSLLIKPIEKLRILNICNLYQLKTEFAMYH